MKKKLITAALLLLLPVMLFADFSYSLDLLSFDPLHKEYTADRDRAGLDFEWLYVDQYPQGVYQSDKDGNNLVYYPFQFPVDVKGAGVSDIDGYDEYPWMALIHLGETLSLFRNTFTFDHWLSPIAFDFSFQGSMIIGMEGGMADMIGYDGVFFYGATARVADMFSLRFGLHHFCTHYGDGTLKLMGLDRDEKLNEGFRMYKKYIRMDAFALGLSIEPVDWMRIYAEYNWCSPLITEHFDTAIFAPSWKAPNGVEGKDDSYHSGIVNFGVEFSYPIFPSLGKTTIAYDCHAYEEGRIVYKISDLEKEVGADKKPIPLEPFYDRNRPWEFEHELIINQEINELVSFEIGYHHGRFPLNSMYHQQCNYVYVGARVNPGATVNIVDTAK